MISDCNCYLLKVYSIRGSMGTHTHLTSIGVANLCVCITSMYAMHAVKCSGASKSYGGNPSGVHRRLTSESSMSLPGFKISTGLKATAYVELGQFML